MIFYYKGYNKSNKVVRGIIDAANKKEAIIYLRNRDIKVLIDIRRGFNNTSINKIGGKMYEKLAEIENKKYGDAKNQKEQFNKKAKAKEKPKNILQMSMGDLGNLIKDKIIPKSNQEDLSIDEKLKEELDELLGEETESVKESYFKSKVYSKIKGILSKDDKEEDILSTIDLSSKDLTLDGFDVDSIEYDKINWDLIEIKQKRNIKQKAKIRLKRKDIIIFTKKIKIMYDSGIQIPRALDILSDTDNKGMQRLTEGLLEDISKGETLAVALSKYPKLFDDTYIALISIGEEKGVLPSVLGDIINFMEQDEKIMKKLKNVSIYPIMVMSAVMVILYLGSKFMIPEFKEIILETVGDSEDFTMPLITEIVFGLAERLPLIITSIAGFFVGFNILRRYIVKLDRGYRLIKDKLELKTPIIKKLFISKYMYVIASNVSLLSKANIQESEAVNFTKNAIDNIYIKNDLTLVSHLMRKEALSLAEALKLQKNMDELLYGMAKVAEESGSTGESLAEAAGFYNDELTNRIEDMKELFQPLSILLIGSIVIPTAIAIYLPIMKMQAAMIS